MGFEVRAIEPVELDDYIRTAFVAFGAHPTESDIEAHRIQFEPGRSLAAFDGPTMVGIGAAYRFQLTVPGAVIPTAHVTTIGVIPTHRRRGVMTELMRPLLDDAHERSEAVSTLGASEGGIYGRFGFGIGTLDCRIDLERRHATFARPFEPAGAVRLVSRAEALDVFGPIYERALPSRPGMMSRPKGWWEARFYDPEHEREGFGALFFAVHDSWDGSDGYVAYRIRGDWPEETPAGVLAVDELVAATDDAYRDLWRFCLGVDLVARIQGHGRPPDEPLFHMLEDPRRLRLTVGDGLWFRLVDVPTALASRMYAAAGRVTFEVRDPVCPWNDGRYVLEGGPGIATCEQTSEEPDLVLSAADLGAAYLGGISLRTLGSAGRVEERTDGALARASAMFAWDPAPWCPHVF
ncbi:MAG: GNAT family N-acetyltransferase [Actinomycetota bacterium]|nr:GNAT family N-acetyltransferase [Actinomycetota bacterium]